MHNPGKPGVYKLTCPYCSNSFNIKLVDQSQPSDNNSAQQSSSSQQATSPQSDTQAAPTGATVTIVCSSCGTKLKIGNAHEGTHNVRCPKCQSVQTYTYNVGSQQQAVQNPEVPKPTKPLSVRTGSEVGCIVIGKSFFRKRKVYELKGKTTIIGRQDVSSPSDIMIDDSTVSRRSVNIEAAANDGELRYTLTVLKATNRVLHNDEELRSGERVILKFGDKIVLGQTKLLFAKSSDYK